MLMNMSYAPHWAEPFKRTHILMVAIAWTTNSTLSAHGHVYKYMCTTTVVAAPCPEVIYSVEVYYA